MEGTELEGWKVWLLYDTPRQAGMLEEIKNTHSRSSECPGLDFPILPFIHSFILPNPPLPLHPTPAPSTFSGFTHWLTMREMNARAAPAKKITS